MSESNLSDLLCCKHCGSTDGYYRKMTMKGKGVFNYSFDGSTDGYASDNIGMHDGIDYNEHKTMYCQDCDKKIGMAKET